MRAIVSYSLVLLLYTTLTSLSINTAFAADWQQFHHNSQRTGFSVNETQINAANINNLELSWTREISPNSTTGLRTASPISVNGIVYLGSGEGSDRTFYALNATDGSLVWSAPTIGEVTSSAAYHDGKVYVSDNGFRIYAFDANNGNIIWQRGFSLDGNGRFNSPLIGDGKLFISQTTTSSGGILRALNPSTGELYWSRAFPFAANLFSSPSFAEVNINGVITPIVYQCHSNNNGGFGFLDAINANTGNIIWSTQVNCRFSSPAISNNIVYIGSDGGVLYALDSATGGIIWTSNSIISSSIDSTPAIDNNTVYVGGQSGFMYALDAQTGELKWKTYIGPITSSAAIANGIIYVGTIVNFGLYALDTNTGNVLWSYTTPKKITASPIISNGYVFVSADRADGIINGPLYAFHLGDVTPPNTSLNQSPIKNSNNWNNTNISIYLNSTDNLNGSGVKEIHYSIDGGLENIVLGNTTNFTISDDGFHTISYWAIDNAGNMEQSNAYSISIDKNAPEIVVNSPSETTYFLNQPITADWVMIDQPSGIDYYSATYENGQNIDTSTVGEHTFTVSATDNAGNTQVNNITYYVRYNFGGFQAPLGNNKVFKTGGTIPIKFQLIDYNGNIINNAVVHLYVAKITDDIIGTDESATSTSNADTGNLFRYDSTNNIYIYNLSTQNNPLGMPGTYQLKAMLNDGSYYTSIISLK